MAEFSAAYLCAEAGISPAVLENQAAYIQGWLAKLGSDKRMIVAAAAQGQKAADYILNGAPALCEGVRPRGRAASVRPPLPQTRISGYPPFRISVIADFTGV